MKVGITPLGNKKIDNEFSALLDIDSDIFLSPIAYGEYKGSKYLITSPLSGYHMCVPPIEINRLITKFQTKNNNKIILKSHPRVIQILNGVKNRISDEDYLRFISSLDLELLSEVVPEHGDFTPWNIFSNKNKFSLIDLEYYCKQGLPHLDLIKYYFQVGRLLLKYEGLDLISFINKESQLEYPHTYISLFLLKEIMILSEEGICYNYILDLLNKINSF